MRPTMVVVVLPLSSQNLGLAQVGKVHAEAIEQRTVIALQQTVQAADDLPVEALKEAFRR